MAIETLVPPVRVKKIPDNFAIECDDCGAVLRYTLRDVWTTHSLTAKSYIVCPHCRSMCDHRVSIVIKG